MSCAKIGGSPLNPYNKPLTCKTGTAATITAALSAIVVTAGVLTLLATQGVHLGPLNALSAVSVPGASVLAGVGALVLIATAAWFIQKAKRNHGVIEEKDRVVIEEEDTSVGEEIDRVVTEEDRARLETLFFDKPQEGVTKTIVVKTLSMQSYTLHYKKEVTFDDARKKLALLLNHPRYAEIRIIDKGKTLDKDSWEESWDTAQPQADDEYAQYWAIIREPKEAE